MATNLRDLLTPPPQSPAIPGQMPVSMGNLLMSVLRGVGGAAFRGLQQPAMPAPPPEGASREQLSAAMANPAYQEGLESRLAGFAGISGLLNMRPGGMALGRAARAATKFEPAPLGAEITPAARTYNEGTGNKGNVWVRNAGNKGNSDRTLMVQFSNDVINPAAAGPKSRADAYYDKLYNSRAGYDRPADFWEIPQWQANIAHNLPNADTYVVRDPAEAVKFLNTAQYKNVAFSALDVNKGLIKDIAEQYPGKIVVGGYGDLKGFEGLKNVEVHPTVKSFVEGEGGKYKEGFDYRNFSGTKTIPRLTMSEGCLHKCAFCTIPKGIKETSREAIMQQADAFAKDLPSSLVYINDKTFGQAKNHTLLPEVYERIRAQNPDFQGFVVQTTASQMKQLDPQFLKDAGVKYAELGIESYNDPILRAAKKPASEAIIDAAADKLKSANVQMIPNIMVGLPGETAATYNRTMSWLNKNADNISHANIYNLAVYDEAPLGKTLKATTAADRNENVVAKSWMDDPSAHIGFNDRVTDWASGQLDKTPTPAKAAFTTIGGEGIAPEMKRGPQLEDLLNPPSTATDLPKGVKYNGKQEGYGSIPSMDLYTDAKTGSTFAVKPGETVEGKLAESQAKFGIGGTKKPSLDLSKLGTEVAPEDFKSGWITPEGKLIDIGGEEHQPSLVKAGAELKRSGDWQKRADEHGLIRATHGVYSSPTGPQKTPVFQLFGHPTDEQLGLMRSLEKLAGNPAEFELTNPRDAFSPYSGNSGSGEGVNQIRRVIEENKFRPNLKPKAELLQPEYEQPFYPSLLDFLNPPQASSLYQGVANA